MTKDEKALLLAMCIGDGSIGLRYNESGKAYTGHLQIIHSIKQLEYLKYKANLLHSIIGGKECVVSEFKPKVGYKALPSYRIGKANKYFKLLHRWLYSNNGKKKFTKNLLKRLTPQGIAIWYMDDGCLGKRKNKDGKITSFKCNMATYCSEEEADIIIEYFSSTYDIQWRKQYHKGSYYLETNSTNGIKFTNLIKDYIVPCMKYKLPEFYFDTSAEQR